METVAAKTLTLDVRHSATGVLEPEIKALPFPVTDPHHVPSVREREALYTDVLFPVATTKLSCSGFRCWA